MKKRKSVSAWALSLPLCALLILLLCGAASASAPALTFALDADGAALSGEQYVSRAASGDTVTVRFRVVRSDAAAPFSLFTIQNEIEFDMDFFEFVEGSIVKGYANADAALQTRVSGQQIIKASALGGPEYAAEQLFCEFQLKVKDNAAGSGWVRCSQTAATDTDHESATITERNLTVSLSGGSSGSSSSGGGSSSGSGSSSGGGGSSSGSGSSSSGSSSGKRNGASSGKTVTDNGNSETVTDTGDSATLADSGNSSETVTDGGNSANDNGNSNATITDDVATDAPSVVSVSDCPKDASCPVAAFADLDAAAWYHDGIHFCVERGIMNGFSDGTLGPQRIVSRAQLATILWNREGKPQADTELSFQDTNPDGWYAGAIRWALREKLLTGYNADSFGPNDVLTRQQLAAILYRYAGSPAQTDAEAKLSAYEDNAQIGSYARDALAWATDAQLIQGTTPVTLNPRGNATRAQTAVIIMRYLLSERKEGA